MTNTPPKIQAYDPKKIKVNSTIAARCGDPSPAKIEAFANNMLERREAGLPHQIQPGVVRVLEDDTVELIIGRHRRDAEIKLNAAIGKDDDPYLFYAIAVPATDQQALLDAIDENEYRVASTLFDRGESWQKLVDFGMSQAEIARRYNTSEATVSDTLACAKASKKIREAVEKGKLTEEAARDIVRYTKDKAVQEEYFQLATQVREATDAILKRAEARANGESVEGESEAEAVTRSRAPKSDAVKKGKGGRKHAPGKVTSKDVRSAVQQKTGKSNKGSGNNFKDLLVLLESKYGERVEEAVPEPYRELAEALEKFKDGGSDRKLIEAWEKCVKTRFASTSSGSAAA